MKRGRLCIAVFVCGTALSSLTSAQAVSDQRSLLIQARQSYYGLRNEGMAAFQCRITRDWNALLADQRKTDPAFADQASATLSQLLFTVTLFANGKVKFAHSDPPRQSKEMMDAIGQFSGGMEQMTSGFFDTWKLFVLRPPFPEPSSEYRLESVGSEYHLSYKDESADVLTTMGRDFAISDLRVTTPEFDSSIKPSFIKTSKGLLLSGYEAHYESKKPEETTDLKVLIRYQEVEHVQVIEKLNIISTYRGSPVAAQLTFSNCQVAKIQQSHSDAPGQENEPAATR